jgi:hypothetical protein
MSNIPMKIRIKTPTGETIEFETDPLETLESLQRRIMALENSTEEILEIRLDCEIVKAPPVQQPNFWRFIFQHTKS